MALARTPVKRWRTATGAASTSGNNVIVAAPGEGSRLILKFLLAQNTTDTPTTHIWRSGTLAAGNLLSAVAPNQAAIVPFALEAGAEIHLPENTALVLNLSGAVAHRYSVLYQIVPFTN